MAKATNKSTRKGKHEEIISIRLEQELLAVFDFHFLRQ